MNSCFYLEFQGILAMQVLFLRVEKIHFFYLYMSKGEMGQHTLQECHHPQHSQMSKENILLCPELLIPHQEPPWVQSSAPIAREAFITACN